MRAKAIASVLFSGLVGCTSLWTQRDHQAVSWSDGDDARIEVWLREGSSVLGFPWLAAADVLATPVLWIVEVDFAVSAWNSEDARIEGGPVGFLVSLLPFFTCMPLDHRTSSYLHLSTPLRLGPEDRAELAAMGQVAGIDWLAARYAQQFPEDRDAAKDVRRWVGGVLLAAPAPAKKPTGGS